MKFRRREKRRRRRKKGGVVRISIAAITLESDIFPFSSTGCIMSPHGLRSRISLYPISMSSKNMPKTADVFVLNAMYT